MKKICAHRNCDKPTMTNRHKYCSESHKYWENQLKKDETKPIKGWGSKNSQMRLDKKARVFASKMRSGKTTVRYW